MGSRDDHNISNVTLTVCEKFNVKLFYIDFFFEQLPHQALASKELN